MATKGIVKTAMMLVVFASFGVQVSSAAVIPENSIWKTISCYAQPSGKPAVKVGTVAYTQSIYKSGEQKRLRVKLVITPDDGKVIDIVRVTFYDGIKKAEERTVTDVRKQTPATFDSKFLKADVSCGRTKGPFVVPRT